MPQVHITKQYLYGIESQRTEHGHVPPYGRDADANVPREIVGQPNTTAKVFEELTPAMRGGWVGVGTRVTLLLPLTGWTDSSQESQLVGKPPGFGQSRRGLNKMERAPSPET